MSMLSTALSTNSYLEYYLTLLGWVINNGVWYALADTSVAAWPFLAIIIQEWLRSRAEGADEGNKGLLSLYRVENRMYMGFIVLLFACVPFVPVSLSQMKLDQAESQRCGVSVPDPSATGWGKGFETALGGDKNGYGAKNAFIPVWWALIHTLSKGITAAAIAAIPCTADVRQIMIELDEARINDKVLLQEVSDFAHDCYGAARYRLNNNTPTITKQQDYDIGWIGSSYFLNTAGYYDTLRSQKPLKDFPYNATRDAGLAQVANGGGYPTCKEWWETGTKGLHDKLLANVNPDVMMRLTDWLKGRTNAEVGDAAIRRLVSPEQQSRTMRPGEVFQQYGYGSRDESGSTVTNVATNLGLGFGMIKYVPTLTALRTALPMVQAFLLMAVVICLPLIMVISTYDLKALMTATFGLFALHFCTFWWELARWVDSSLLTVLYGDVGMGYKLALQLPTAFANDGTVTDMVMEYTMGALFLLLPAIFFAAMAWAGVAVGRSLAGVGQMMGNASSGASNAGGSTAGKVAGAGEGALFSSATKR